MSMSTATVTTRNRQNDKLHARFLTCTNDNTPSITRSVQQLHERRKQSKHYGTFREIFFCFKRLVGFKVLFPGLRQTETPANFRQHFSFDILHSKSHQYLGERNCRKNKILYSVVRKCDPLNWFCSRTYCLLDIPQFF